MERTEKKYDTYQVRDFLRDDEFLQAQLCPTEESDAYWAEVMRRYPEKETAMRQAAAVLRSVAVNRGVFSEEEEKAVWESTWKKYTNYRRRRTLYAGLAAAACLAVLCLIPVFKRTAPAPSDSAIAAWQPAAGQPDTARTVQLILSDTEKITLDEDADIVWDKKNKIQVTGRTTKSSVVSEVTRETAYSQLIVPVGKRSFLTLCDGTKIWVNSGTQLRFPTDMNGDRREIYVDGEIYIEVAEDKKHPFLVYSPSFRVKVYGTKFNVTAYAGDSVRSVVLVDGKVSVRSGAEEVYLHPDQMYRAEEGGYRLEMVEASRYISWKDGVLQLYGEKLADIAVRLSRYYGLHIECVPAMARRSCTGKLVLFDDAEKTLHTLADIFPVRYERAGDSIRIDAAVAAPPAGNR